MKRSIIIIVSIVTMLVCSSTSCDKEPLTQIKEIETRIYNQLRAHREANGLTGYFVHQFIIVEEAQKYSAKMAFGDQDVSSSGIQEHWEVIHSKIGGYNDLTLVQSTSSAATAENIVQTWTDDPLADSLILLDYTQCGAGVEYNNGTAYVTVLMMKVD